MELPAFLTTILTELSKPILGPINGFHILMLAFWLLTRLINQKDNKNNIKASHILVKTEDECKKLKKQCETSTFEELAKEHSICPSGKNGGSLGSFGKGRMVDEFDKVCFDPKTEVGKVYGPIKTEFGFHLLKVTYKPEDKKNN
ncbi:hypothetical protein BC833DRAFT_565133 [Globomyces pollinis-pini]|nr:hypothetical protein BC833DRAFT_565133 [Globomyces pollinis-pini]KAJ2994358.1 hypothetical protein HDV02_001671 [Globomyces sp. JEL0801]